MGFFDLLWIFFMLSALQPIVQQRLLEMRRLRLLAHLERRRGSRAIALVHRQETMSFLGFPLMRYIDINDSEEVLAAGQIAHALRHHKGKVTVFVPHYAMSGGTLIAMAADEIVMSANAVLGPVDPQLDKWPAASILTVLEQKEPKDIDDETLIRADIGRKAISQVESTVQELLSERMPADRAKALAAQLVSGTWTHDYPITAARATELGLPVSTAMPAEVYTFMQLFPQPTRTRPSVEYVPVPYGGRLGRDRG
jgi:ClpP class serine protease